MRFQLLACHALIDGVRKTLAWVVSVVLPPMAIFFPLFTLLEGAGFLPRIALDLATFFAGPAATASRLGQCAWDLAAMTPVLSAAAVCSAVLPFLSFHGSLHLPDSK